MADAYTFSDEDPRYPTVYHLLMKFATDERYPPAIRVAALASASKVEPKYLHNPIDLPTFSSVAEAETYKMGIAQREARNELDAETVSRIYSRIDNWIADQRADAHALRQEEELELKRLAADASDQPQIIQITGGLPELPGTNVTMPSVNGHAQTDLLPPVPVIPVTMITKGDGFIFTWIQNKSGAWDLLDKLPDPRLMGAGPALGGTTEE
jgi:hypothetical protein